MICLNPGSTRSEISAKADLSITSVGIAVDRLIDDGLVSAFPGRSVGGRPAETLYPAKNSVFLADVRDQKVRAFCLDLSGKKLLFEEMAVDFVTDHTKALCELTVRASRIFPCEDGGIFSAGFLSSRVSPIDPDSVRYVRSRLSPLFIRTYDTDRLSAEITVSKIRFPERAVYLSVSRDRVTAALCTMRDGNPVLSDLTNLVSAYGSSFGRVFAACRHEKEAGEAVCDALLNTVGIILPDLIAIEISGIGFDEKLGKHIKTAFTKMTRHIPEIKTYYRDEERLTAYALSLLRRVPFEKE